MPSAAPVGGDSISRSELRKRSAGTTASQPTPVWGLPIAPVIVEAQSVVPDAAPIVPPLTRRGSRAKAAPATGAPAVEPVREAVTEVSAETFELREPEVRVASEPEVLAQADAPEPVEPVLLVQTHAAPESETIVGAASVDDAAPRSSDPQIDEFAHAAKLFSFTGETRVVAPAEEVSPPIAAPAAPRAVTSSRRSGAAFRRVATASFSVGVMGIVGLLTVGMTTPAEAVAAVGSSDDGTVSIAAIDNRTQVSKDTEEIQAYVAPAEVTNATLDRAEGYSTVSLSQMAAEIAAESGINYSSSVFNNDQSSPIQWPFAVGVGLSSGFGMRWGRMHEGLDFIPGEGAPIQAIADGTVRIATESGGAYGVTVYIDHVIDGQMITSHYAHMQYGSLEVSEGDHVTVGTVVGHTGNTGRSYGAHLHFELLVNGTTAIDPLPWLREHAGG
ncbi:MAG TPA: peptidoglycan DD-metalloendopeptidase family protein [Microbacterium sp.]|nr:peptidoglycan DD-metalloendopeptidase family protein [Microbacterium sp.]